MSNIIIVPKTAAVVESAWGNLDANDFHIPRFQLVQRSAVKQEYQGKAGQYVSQDGKAVEIFKGATLMSARKTRVLYGEGRGGGPSRCGSSNWREPDSRYTDPPWHSCLSCPLQMWESEMSGSDEAKKREWEDKLGAAHRNVPLCKEQYDLIMVDETFQPFFVQFQKTSLKVVQNLLINRIRNNHGVPWGARFDMGAALHTDKRGSWYVPTFENFVAYEGDENLRALEKMSQKHSIHHEKVREVFEAEDKKKEEGWSDAPF